MSCCCYRKLFYLLVAKLNFNFLNRVLYVMLNLTKIKSTH